MAGLMFDTEKLAIMLEKTNIKDRFCFWCVNIIGENNNLSGG